MSVRSRRAVVPTIAAYALALLSARVYAADSPAFFARIDPADTTTGYLARLLINETSFPGERAFISEADTRAAMVQILWVLDSRLHAIPKGYSQWQLAGVKSDDILEIITGSKGRPQCEGFSRNSAGKAIVAARVEQRLNYLLKIANKGSTPGRFADLLNYGQGLAAAYSEGGIEQADRFTRLRAVGNLPVTGRGYSWMTDVNDYHPGGNFVRIPDTESGSLGGNRFFTLRRNPK